MVTIKGLKEMRRNESNSFKKWVLSDILSQGNKQDILNYLKNAQNGCESGAVSSLIYYRDTKRIFSKYFEEILEIVSEYTEDSLVVDSLNYNSLVWFAYDIIISEINMHFED